ncbi:MAG TPA: hypothetical protein PLP42_19300 [Acidobacteriota bacterium]|mgnify:CR=1 FL=1|nr:hypothetical protein [Acidobacteriota bacterium]
MWFDVMVPDIRDTFARALAAGCREVQPVTEMAEHGVTNASFMDPFGYHWLLNQVHRNVSFDERVKLWEKKNEC